MEAQGHIGGSTGVLQDRPVLIEYFLGGLGNDYPGTIDPL